MKKITLIYLGRKGGAVPYSFEMTKSLLKNKVHIQAILSNYIGNKAEWIELSNKNENLDLIFLSTYKSKFGFIKSFLPDKQYKDAIKNIKNFNPDVLYLPMISLNARKLVGQLKQYTLVTTIHDYNQHPGMKNPVSNYIFNYIKSISNKFIVLTKSYIDPISHKYSIPQKNIAHIPHANFAYYNKKDEEVDYRLNHNILFFGRITKYKGLYNLLKAMDLVWKVYPNIHLNIVGQGNLTSFEESFINNNIERIKLNNDWVNDADVWDIFRENDFTVLPYIEASQSGVVALSFSCGRNVIATDVGGLRDQVEPANGIIVPINDVFAIASKIISLYKNPDQIVELNKKAYKYAHEEITWDKSAHKLLDFIYD